MFKENPIKEKVDREVDQARRGLRKFGREFFDEDDEYDDEEPDAGLDEASDDPDENSVEKSFEKNGIADDQITAFFTVLALATTVLCFLYSIVYLVTWPFRLIRGKKGKTESFDSLD